MKFDLPAESADLALRRFASQSGQEVLFATDVARGVRTNAVKGEFTAQEAANRLLAGTVLVADLDEKSKAFVVNRVPDPNAPRAVPVEAAARPAAKAEKASAEKGVVAMEAVEITGSRIRSVLGEQGINPVMVMTRADIERSAVSSLADLRNLIPQLSVGSVTSFDGNSSGSAPEGRLLFTLRGLQGNNTLILIDGRRVPRTGQRVGATENYELTGVTLEEIERVEVLLDGGSAIYGADAIGGVINIIRRKNFSGAELTLGIDNPFDTDAALKRASLSVSHRTPRFSVRASVSYDDQNALRRSDRYWLKSDDRRYIGGTDGRSTTLFVGGVVRPAQTGVTFPGTNGATVLRIPSNSNGRNLTIADFVNAGAPTDAERYDSGTVVNAINEYFRATRSVGADFTVAKWLRVGASGNFSRYRSYGNSGPVTLSTSLSTNPLVNTSIPAGYPGNPFGIPINVVKPVWELGFLDRRYQIDTYSAAFTVDGELPGGWRYDGGIGWSKSDPINLDPVFQFSAQPLAAAIQSANPPILLNNSLTYGAANPAGTLEAFFLTGTNQDIPETWSYDLKANGPVYDWWAGQINAAAGWETREEYVDFIRQQFAAATEAAQPTGHRTVHAFFAELAVPLVGESNHIPLVHALNGTVAARHERYDEFGEPTKPRYGASYRPFKWIMLRGTYGEAFKVPTLSDLNRPTSRQNQTFGATGSFVLFDTFRNEQVLGPVVNITGGNPNLLPEESTTRNYGVILEAPVRMLKGLSLSVDHWDIRMTNRVGSVSYQDRLAFRPDLFIRADRTAADIAANIPGRILEVDNRSINIALFRTAGYDYTLRYNRLTHRWGQFDLRASGTETKKYESVTRPGLNPLTTSSPLSRPFRGIGTLDWTFKGYGLGFTTTYQEGFRTAVTSATSYTPSVILWDVRGSISLRDAQLFRRDSRLGRWTDGLRLNVAIMNALGLEPPLTATGTASGAVSPLGRRYVVTLRKSL